ncbi:metallophosphoesterase [Sphingomonas immobilis]|uniref:Metallophosphoesterase n=1 Tax=Sphingomonas immobilis TaxID=3063997 RepID=A0ABT9A5U6_9SPHN|nr:metallophosphoesterase [Sphingomonas sp. CA1-15]MDO7844117.1 metallophosphoesterase [Sphingomonas sp. CA1-15]
MLSRLRTTEPPVAVDAEEAWPTPAAPQDMRIYAIGDVHGRRDLLDMMLSQIVADLQTRPAERFTLVFLGDLIDRGPDSAGVVERILRLQAERVPLRIIQGNHEQILLEMLDGDTDARDMFGHIGGYETMTSYGLTDHEMRSRSADENVSRLRELIPETHLALFRAGEESVQLGDYLFVHAGVQPGVALDAQSARDLRWIRAPFLNSDRYHGSVIVHGHSVSKAPVDRANRIGVDTGAFATGVLSAVVLEGETRRFLEARGVARARTEEAA